MTDQQATHGGPRVRLRPITPHDYDYVARLETSGDRLVRYRHRGSTPPPEAFAQRLWQGVLCQFLVESVADRQPLGVVAAFAADYRGASAQIAVVGDDDGPSHLHSGLIIEGLTAFIDYLFDAFPLRKLYAYVLEQNFGRLQGLVPTFVQVEGILLEHEWLEGRWCDMYVLACHRSNWSHVEQASRSRGGRRSLAGSEPVPSSPPPSSVEPTAPEHEWSNFLRLVASTTGRAVDPHTSRSATLVHDLAMDSLALMQLLDLIDERGAGSGQGQRVPDEALDQITTLGDAFSFYAAYSG